MRWLWLSLALLLSLSAAQAQVTTVRPFPDGPAVTPITASSTGTTDSITVTLAKAAGQFTYLCGFTITSGGTTAATLGDATITGVPTTMHFTYVFVSSGQGLLGVAFPGCITSSAANTDIVLTIPAGGAGTTVSGSMWGYRN